MKVTPNFSVASSSHDADVCCTVGLAGAVGVSADFRQPVPTNARLKKIWRMIPEDNCLKTVPSLCRVHCESGAHVFRPRFWSAYFPESLDRNSPIIAA